MSLNTLISTALSTLLKEGAIAEILVEKAGEKAIAIFQAHFTFSAFEIANSYQKSYAYALAAICAGMASPDQKFRFFQKLTHSKIEREFADQIEPLYFQPFVAQCDVQAEVETSQLRSQLIDNIKKLSKLPPIFSAEKRDLTEPELAAFIHYKGVLAITDVILEQLHTVPDYLAVRDDTVEAFFRFEDLLGNATLFFLHEIFRRDARAKETIEALQREGLLLDMRDVKATQEKMLTRLQQQFDEQNASAMQAFEAKNFSKAAQMSSQLDSLQNTIKNVPQSLQAAQTVWKNTHQQWVDFAARFHSWGGLLNSQLSEVLAETETLHWEIKILHDDVKALKQSMADLMARFDLSAQVKLSDEFTHHNTTSLKLIQAAITQLKALPGSHPDYNKVMIMGGSLLSSTGDIATAEKLFLHAFNQAAPHSDEKALASFNLFLVRLRNKDYGQALVDLQTAIAIDRHYALHDIDKYPMVRLVGAGGMGCVFLCHDQWGEKQVVVKCFWEGRKGTRQEVFGEAMLMRKVAGAYVPEPMDCGYVDAHRQERPYFVSEYIEGALDGENWLTQHGAFDVSTGIAVGCQIAKGLEVAHGKGIYHLDLKPANLLFKETDTGLMIKIIDFGLARVATSLRQEAMSRRSTAGMTQFGQTIVGTLLYAPPEQMGETHYGKPGAKSDFYAFGATLYRLMTNESPRTLNPRRLSEAPPELFDLLCHCKEENPALRPETAAEVIKRLESLLVPQAPSPLKAEVREESQYGKGFQFEVVTVNRKGEITHREQKQARSQTEDLGKGVMLEMVYIPSGTFNMGSPETEEGRYSDESPQHEVIVQPFFMGKYPVTQAQWQAVMGNNPSRFKGENRPVEKVSWEEAVEFCQRLSKKTGKTYRLPSEAEWEYACRAGTTTPFYFGETITTDLANYDGNYPYASAPKGVYREETTDVGIFPPNAFGLYDMHGNVWEWCVDPWHENYEGAPDDGSVWKGVDDEGPFVRRGGSWVNLAGGARSAYRSWGSRTDRGGNHGFRLARLL